MPFDEPLDDLIDTKGPTYEQATVDDEGVYRFTTISGGPYYITWAPDAADTMHLPGGDQCREPLESEPLVNTQLNIKVSGAASETATYVGSSTCLTCHGGHRSTRTAHRVGLQATGVRGNLQDISPWPNFDDGLQAFEDAAVLYYYECNGAASGFSKCKVARDDNTVPDIWFTVALHRDDTKQPGEEGAYYLDVVNEKDTAAPKESATYNADMTYGGAVHKQRYMTRFDNGNGTSSYHLLMVQYNYELAKTGICEGGTNPGTPCPLGTECLDGGTCEGKFGGDPTFPSSNNWPWRDYHSERWYDFNAVAVAPRLIEPVNSKAFDNSCAGCHFNSFRIEGSDADGWAALPVPDPNGAMDFDGDGRLDEINTGCEACHGPGSEHLEQRPQGGYIVSPELLTPGRELMICGRCHSRPQGLGAGVTDAPLSVDNLMPLPGTRRAVFAEIYTNRVDGTESSFWPTPSLDSKSHHQQYSDFIRSAHYRNEFELMTCSTCHDPHGNDENRNQLLIAAEDNTSCTQCHTEAEPVEDHVATVTVPGAHAGQDLLCVTCHMVGTATSGAQTPQLVDDAPPFTYFWGDISGHRFGAQPKEWLCDPPAQPVVPFTNKCGTCHVDAVPDICL